MFVSSCSQPVASNWNVLFWRQFLLIVYYIFLCQTHLSSFKTYCSCFFTSVESMQLLLNIFCVNKDFRWHINSINRSLAYKQKLGVHPNPGCCNIYILMILFRCNSGVESSTPSNKSLSYARVQLALFCVTLLISMMLLWHNSAWSRALTMI